MDSGSALHMTVNDGVALGRGKQHSFVQLVKRGHLYASTSMSMAVGSRPCENSARLLQNCVRPSQQNVLGCRSSTDLQSRTKNFMREGRVPYTPATSLASKDMHNCPSQLANSCESVNNCLSKTRSKENIRTWCVSVAEVKACAGKGGG
jgi:hypothetical protein